jgi:hypothetical protein
MEDSQVSLSYPRYDIYIIGMTLLQVETLLLQFCNNQKISLGERESGTVAELF